MTKENEFDSIMIILKDISDRLKEVEVVFPSSVLPSRCYGNPPSPEGEGLTGRIHVVISSVSREIPRDRNVARAPAPAKCPHGFPAERERYGNNRTLINKIRSAKQPFPLPRDSHATATPTLRMTNFKGVRGG